MVYKRRAKPIKRRKPDGWRSGFEKKLALYLKTHKTPFEYEAEKIPYIVPEKKRSYLPDFKITTKSGKTIYIEAKGRWVAADRAKIELVIEQNPTLDIRMLFMRDNSIRKDSKTKYSDYCEKRGIKYHVSALGHPPLGWLSE